MFSYSELALLRLFYIDMTRTNGNNIILDARLASAASFVREGAVVCDVGTDHAYLPIYLLASGRARFAIASDINRGPLESARKNAARYGLSDKMRFTLANGLNGLPLREEGVGDIVICGMGGELIADIIAASDYTREAGVRLILQPMSYPERLREYLAKSGYRILDERLSEAAGKLYTCILVEYDGARRDFSAAEYMLGECNIKNREALFIPYAERLTSALREKINGMKTGGLDVYALEECLSEIKKLIGA